MSPFLVQFEWSDLTNRNQVNVKFTNFLFLSKIIFKNKTLDVNIRWMAMVLMKNGVERYWRKSAPQ